MMAASIPAIHILMRDKNGVKARQGAGEKEMMASIADRLKSWC
jgi:hypothetical protein